MRCGCCCPQHWVVFLFPLQNKSSLPNLEIIEYIKYCTATKCIQRISQYFQHVQTSSMDTWKYYDTIRMRHWWKFEKKTWHKPPPFTCFFVAFLILSPSRNSKLETYVELDMTRYFRNHLMIRAACGHKRIRLPVSTGCIFLSCPFVKLFRGRCGFALLGLQFFHEFGGRNKSLHVTWQWNGTLFCAHFFQAVQSIS